MLCLLSSSSVDSSADDYMTKVIQWHSSATQHTRSSKVYRSINQEETFLRLTAQEAFWQLRQN